MIIFFLLYNTKCLALINYLFSKYLLNAYCVPGTLLRTGIYRTTKQRIPLLSRSSRSCWGDQQLNRQFPYSLRGVAREEIQGTGRAAGSLTHARRVWGRLSKGTDSPAEVDWKSKLAFLGERWLEDRE